MKIPVEQFFPEHIRPILGELRNAKDPRRHLFDNVNLPIRRLSQLNDWVEAGMPPFVYDDFGAPITRILYGGASIS